MKTTTAIIALLCIGMVAAQWPCQDWGFNGPKPNCASCTTIGSGFSTYKTWSGNGGSSYKFQPFSVCTACTVGFFLNQSSCQNCTAGCDFCNPNGACTPQGCATGYWYYPVNNTCLACPAALNCTTCGPQANDFFQYASLPVGQWLNWETGLVSTTATSSSTTYQSTYGGGSYFTLNKGTGNSFATSTSGSQFTCSTCGSGWYVNTAGACVACPTNAVTCHLEYGSYSGAQILSIGSCLTGYTVTAGTAGVDSCVATTVIDANCQNPYTCSGGSGIVQFTIGALATPYQSYEPYQIFINDFESCNPGFYWTGTACAACLANCVSCVNATGCNVGAGTCATGYVVNSVDTATNPTASCVACTAANCWVCDPSDASWSATASTTSCAICMPFYILNMATKTCVACPANCSNATYSANGLATTINGVSTQSGLQQGLWLQYQNSPDTTYQNGWKGLCVWSVSSATTPVCLSCGPNTTLVQTDLTSTYNSTYGGTIIATGGGICVPLPGNCSQGVATSATATTQAGTTCNQCYPGFGLYWVSAGVAGCRPCLTPGCVSCDWTGVCQQCNVSQFLPPNSCLQCPYNCSVCANATWCYNNCTKNYAYQAATGLCLPIGAERIALGLLSLISAFLYFL